MLRSLSEWSTQLSAPAWYGMGKVTPVRYAPDFLKARGDDLRCGFVFIYPFGPAAANSRELHFDSDGTLLYIVAPGELHEQWREDNYEAWRKNG